MPDQERKTLVVTADQLADWIERQGADKWWRTDGEYDLASGRCDEMVAALRKHGGKIELHAPPTASGGYKAVAADATIDDFAWDDDWHERLEGSWIADGTDSRWVLIEDIVAREAWEQYEQDLKREGSQRDAAPKS